MSEQFLIIQTAFIGDVVLATSLIENLHNAFPGAQIDFMVRKGNEALLQGHPYLRQVLIWDKKKDKLFNLWKLISTIRKTRYDKVINVQRYLATGLMTTLSGAAETIGFDKNPLSFTFKTKVRHVFAVSTDIVHEIDRNNLLIAKLTTTPAMRPRLYPSAEDKQAVAAYKLQNYLTISPASVWFTKQYPAFKWVAFINKIPDSYTICLLGGPGDKPIADEMIKQSTRPGIINLCGSLTFLQSAELMKGANMNYVNDSAPMHFASAVNAPVTAIYCSTIPAFGYGPLSDQRIIVERKKPLYCRPCGIHGKKACPEGHFKCAMEIEDEQLLKAISQAG